MNRSIYAGILLVAAFVMLGPAEGRAQLRPGVQASYALDQFNGVWGLGGRLVVGVPLVPVRLAGSADYFFTGCASGSDCQYLQANVNVLVSLPLLPIPLFRYVGAGWNFQRIEFEEATDYSGINVVGGAGLSDRTFFELRYEFISDYDDQLVITLGVLFL